MQARCSIPVESIVQRTSGDFVELSGQLAVETERLFEPFTILKVVQAAYVKGFLLQITATYFINRPKPMMLAEDGRISFLLFCNTF